MGETPRNSVLLANAIKKLKIGKSIIAQAGFIGDGFSWKRTGPAKVGMGAERHRFRVRQGNGGQRLGWQAISRMVRAMVASTGVARSQVTWPESQAHQTLESIVLRAYVVGGMEEGEEGTY